jgi:pimeloyl-ACP methyl ester carboxylesterase
VAVATGLHFPDRVTTLGIAYPAFGPGDDFSNPVAVALFEMVGQVGLTGLLDTMESAGPDVVPPAEMAAARENFGRQDDESMRACGAALRGTRLLDTFDVLERLTMPALVIGRPGDALHPVELAHEYAAHLPDSRLVLDDGPEPFFLRPGAYADLLVGFHA